MTTLAGRTPYWPPYLPETFPERALFLLEGHNVYDERGNKTMVPTYDALVEYLMRRNGLCFTQSLVDSRAFPFLDEAIVSHASLVSCTKKGVPTNALVRRGNTTRKIVPYAAWRERGAITFGFLREMRDLYNYVGVGTHGTPGALGHATMLNSFRINGLTQRHSSPNKRAQKFLWKHHVGGRCDTFGIGLSYPSLIELDMSSAYLAHYMEHPTGTSMFFLGDNVGLFATYFAECEVTIEKELALGPFPVKRRNAKKVIYPTLPGRYITYLWREQVGDCLAAGCAVRLLRGWGWRDITTDNAYWAKDTYQLRMGAYGGSVESDMKKIIVAAIGRHGMHNLFHQLVSEAEQVETDRVLLGSDFEPLAYFIHPTLDWTTPAMTHWFSYTIMQTARTLYRAALPFAEQGRLVMTNYDSILVLERDERRRYVKKYSAEAATVAAGEWRWQELTGVKILGNRSLTCDQKVVTPGVTH
jgi:hypothetical protein